MDSTDQTPGSGDEVFNQLCGYRVGRSALLSFNASWPFGLIELRSRQLTLNCIASQLVFWPSTVVKVSLYYGLFSVGVRIEHTIADYPRFVVLWARHPEKLIQRLKMDGYLVA